MSIDLSGPDDAAVVAVLLHPHPDMGGDRYHPLVSHLYRRLPEAGVGAARFDLTSADPAAAHAETRAAVEAAAQRWPAAVVAMVGYSFGAGVAAGVDERVAGWFLVAPVAAALDRSSLADDPRPKVVVVPERDQFSPPETVRSAVAGWTEMDMRVVPGDHFLGASMAEIVDDAVAWVVALAGAA